MGFTRLCNYILYIVALVLMLVSRNLSFFCTPGSSEVLTWRKLPLHMSIITSSHVTKLMRHMHQFCGDETDLSQIPDCCLPGQTKLHDIVSQKNFSCMLK